MWAEGEKSLLLPKEDLSQWSNSFSDSGHDLKPKERRLALIRDNQKGSPGISHHVSWNLYPWAECITCQMKTTSNEKWSYPWGWDSVCHSDFRGQEDGMEYLPSKVYFWNTVKPAVWSELLTEYSRTRTKAYPRESERRALSHNPL